MPGLSCYYTLTTTNVWNAIHKGSHPHYRAEAVFSSCQTPSLIFIRSIIHYQTKPFFWHWPTPGHDNPGQGFHKWGKRTGEKVGKPCK